MNLRNFASVNDRRKALESDQNITLEHIGNFTLDESVASSKNCENMIGVSQVPLGIAGPLLVNGSNFNGNYYIPIATTEGALVASVSRGAKAISLSGGANTFSEKVGQTRGPVFEVKSLSHMKEVQGWIEQNNENLKDLAASTSSHLELLRIEKKGLSNQLFLRLYFNTQDAMGMNMVTIASERISEEVEKSTGAKIISVAGNYDIDKKAAWLNFIQGRGIQVWAETLLTKEVLETVLKTKATRFFEVWLSKCMIGSAMSGSLGFNSQYANIIAGIFLATGQDPAHIVEGSMGITTAKVLESGDLHVSVYMPALQVGIIGGGTGLATQAEALKILGVKSPDSVYKFAEIIGGAVLAGEISLLSSLSEGTLAKAHKELGR